jgi:hypothetical protein
MYIIAMKPLHKRFNASSMGSEIFSVALFLSVTSPFSPDGSSLWSYTTASTNAMLVAFDESGFPYVTLTGAVSNKKKGVKLEMNF